MPADVTQASKFLFHSDYPVDKLVALGTLDFTVPATTNGFVYIPHDYSFIPLMWGSWALDASYSTLYGLNSGPVSAAPTVSPFSSLMKVRADATQIILEGQNYTGSTVNFYARIFGFEPTTADQFLDGTSPVGDGFQFNTDYNYTKLYLHDYIDQAAGTGSPVSRTIPHGLGTNTQIITWKEDAGVVTPLTIHDGGEFQVEDVVVSIDNTNITFTFSGSHPALRVHYRCYIDE